jgi:hypothetical protein
VDQFETSAADQDPDPNLSAVGSGPFFAGQQCRGQRKSGPIFKQLLYYCTVHIFVLISVLKVEKSMNTYIFSIFFKLLFSQKGTPHIMRFYYIVIIPAAPKETVGDAGIEFFAFYTPHLHKVINRQNC